MKFSYKKFYDELVITNYFWFRNKSHLTEEILEETSLPN
jgi:hypothetical protein